MKDEIRPVGQQLVGNASDREVRDDRTGLERRGHILPRLADVSEQEMRDLLPADTSIASEPIGELAADHARATRDQNAITQVAADAG